MTPLSRRSRSLLGGLATVAVLSLSACSDGDPGGSDDTASDTSSSAQAEETPEAEEVEPSESASASEDAAAAPAAGTGGNPAWALPPVEKGDLLTTIEVGEVSVAVYQVGTAKADDTGSFVDPDTNKPLIEVGDELVFVNYVITNNGAPIDLGSSLVDISPRYDDWPYMQGMDGLTGDDLYAAQGINDFGLAPDGYSDAGVYTFGTGETFSYGENFEHQPGSPITFDVSYVPVDAAGDLLHDDKVEAEGKATIA
ncbi:MULTISPECIES: hypothetical protein [unclassified Nocardioides]|uniref:hypothetical protein n=1 Tax=unclassified Nocardioides TaxID=2615069 RepID=UPI0030142892